MRCDSVPNEPESVTRRFNQYVVFCLIFKVNSTNHLLLILLGSSKFHSLAVDFMVLPAAVAKSFVGFDKQS